MSKLHYNYDAAKAYCAQLGLVWLGDDFARSADTDAWEAKFTQEQIDIAMQHHLWQVKILFDAENYSIPQRMLIALYFIFPRIAQCFSRKDN